MIFYKIKQNDLYKPYLIGRLLSKARFVLFSLNEAELHADFASSFPEEENPKAFLPTSVTNGLWSRHCKGCEELEAQMRTLGNLGQPPSHGGPAQHKERPFSICVPLGTTGERQLLMALRKRHFCPAVSCAGQDHSFLSVHKVRKHRDSARHLWASGKYLLHKRTKFLHPAASFGDT